MSSYALQSIHVLVNSVVHQLKQSCIYRLIEFLRCLTGIQNPSFEWHFKYLDYALCNLRCKAMLYTSVKCRGYIQVQHLKMNSKFEVEFELQNSLRVFQFKFEFKSGGLLKWIYNSKLVQTNVALGRLLVIWLNGTFGW
jgi:hypothetical protein